MITRCLFSQLQALSLRQDSPYLEGGVYLYFLTTRNLLHPLQIGFNEIQAPPHMVACQWWIRPSRPSSHTRRTVWLCTYPRRRSLILWTHILLGLCSVGTKRPRM